MKRYFVIAAVALTLIACGGPTDATEDDINSLNERANGATNAPSTPAKLAITNGDWKVGAKDNLAANIISPGTYVVSSPKNGFGCYWETVRRFDGEGNYLIKNGNSDPGASTLAVVKKNYAGLRLQGDCIALKEKPKSLGSTVGKATAKAATSSDIGSGTPGAYCATNRLGKTFVKSGNTYECKGPKPYRWRKI